jgi:glycosyltransferase involved in cell wall biosynthesis
MHWFRDIWESLFIVINNNDKYDLIICLDCLNLLSGFVLKKLGRTKYLIYYSIDFTSKRFIFNWLNFIYIFLDKIAYRYADEVWNVSDGIRDLRRELKYSLSPQKEKTVPVGIYPEDYNRNINKDKNTIVYLGSLSKLMGVQLAIHALPKLLHDYPSLKLEIIGTGEFESYLISQVIDYHLTNNITFISSIDKNFIISRLYSGYIGIAPYENLVNSYKKYCDPTKIKEYFAAEIPVIITKVPRISVDIEQLHLGLAINYNQADFINAIKQLISNHILYNDYTNNISKYIKRYYWNNIFDKALKYYNHTTK